MKCARVTKNLVEVAHNKIFQSVHDILCLFAHKMPGHVLVCLEYFLFHFRGSEIFILGTRPHFHERIHNPVPIWTSASADTACAHLMRKRSCTRLQFKLFTYSLLPTQALKHGQN